jgi:hypothetical protein
LEFETGNGNLAAGRAALCAAAGRSTELTAANGRWALGWPLAPLTAGRCPLAAGRCPLGARSSKPLALGGALGFPVIPVPVLPVHRPFPVAGCSRLPVPGPLSTTSRAFCDLNKAPAQCCSLKV